MGNYDEAVKNLEPSANDDSKTDDHAVHRAAFLAMAHSRIPNWVKARVALAEAQQLITGSAVAHSKDTRSLVAEAATLAGQTELGNEPPAKE